MKKRLKNLLALCMVAMMMLAMSTGVVSAETYYAHMADGGVYQYKIDKNHNNDPRALYKGIPDNGTIAMNPGDVIVPFELTGGDIDSGGKYDDFCGTPFYVVKAVNKESLNKDYGYGKTVYEALSATYKDALWAHLGTVYKCDNTSKFNNYNTIYELKTTPGVEVVHLNGTGKVPVTIQQWNEAENPEAITVNSMLYEKAYFNQYGYVQCNQLEPEKLEYEGNDLIKGFGYTKRSDDDNKQYCCALKLPKCEGGLGSHFDVKKISAEQWVYKYSPTFYVEDEDTHAKGNVATQDNVPTGIKPLTSDLETILNSQDKTYDLIDTGFAYFKNSETDSTYSYDYDRQSKVGLVITEAPNKYTINFNAGDGGEGDMGLEKVADNCNTTGELTYSAGYKLPANKFTKTGYTFKYWQITEATYPDPIDSTLAPIVVDTKQAPYKEHYEDKAEYIPGNHNETVTLQAQWTPNKYKVKYNANTGTGNMDVQELTYGKEEPLSENKFTKEGYTFTKWTTEADGTGTAYKDKAEVKNLATEEGAEITLYAQWEEVVVPVDEPDDKSPTGDNMNITLLMALLLLSGCGIAGAGLYRRNHVK